MTAVDVYLSDGTSTSRTGDGQALSGGMTGLWVSESELTSHAKDGTTNWSRVQSLSDNAVTGGDAANVLSHAAGHHAMIIWAAAVRGVADPSVSHISKALQGLADAKSNFDTTYGTSTYAGSSTHVQADGWLALGRNMPCYIFTADLLRETGDLTGSALTDFNDWMNGFAAGDIIMSDNQSSGSYTMAQMAVTSGSNADVQVLCMYAAVARYVDDSTALADAWDKFRGYVGDSTSSYWKQIDIQTPDGVSWAADETQSPHPVPVNPAGATKEVPTGKPGAGNTYSIDGAPLNDIRRGGAYQWFPVYTQYPWVGMAGSFGAAVILGRAGYDPWTLESSALKRMVDYMWFLDQHADNTESPNTTSGWWDTDRAVSVKHLAEIVYSSTWGTLSWPSGEEQCIDLTHFTHTTTTECGA